MSKEKASDVLGWVDSVGPVTVAPGKPNPSPALAARVRALEGLLREAEAALSSVRTLDCGAHYCRYCPAKSPAWEHGPSCPYVESQREYASARDVRTRIAALLSAEGDGGTLQQEEKD